MNWRFWRHGKPAAAYDVSFAIYGRVIAVVRVAGEDEDSAREFAERYLHANLTPQSVVKSPGSLPPAGREIRLVPSAGTRMPG